MEKQSKLGLRARIALTEKLVFYDSRCVDRLIINHYYSDMHSDGLKMEIVFKRRLTNELLTTYLPSFLLLLISYATTLFKPFYFEAAVTVNLTVMLVTTTLFIRSLFLNLLCLISYLIVSWESFLLLLT